MTDFTRLERADDMISALLGFVHRRVEATSAAAWNNDPANARTRERTARLSRRLTDRRDAEVERLAFEGVPQRAAREHLIRRRETRAAR